VVPPFDEVTALGVGFVPFVDPDVVGADASLAVEQDGRGPPLAVDLDLFDEIDAAAWAGVLTN